MPRVRLVLLASDPGAAAGFCGGLFRTGPGICRGLFSAGPGHLAAP
jgi:hypothetical protein